MQVKFKNDETVTQSVVFVKQDRKARNAANLQRHTEATVAEFNTLLGQIKSAYCRSTVFEDINVKTLNAKVYKPSGADRLSEAVHALNVSLEGKGVEIVEKLDKGVFSITYKMAV
jgi:phosphoribosyl-dephospho-CoA transferase